MPQKTIIGSDARVTFVGLAENIPAKIDTGADTSAVWASNIFVDKQGFLHYKLFGEDSPYYTDKEIITDDYSVAKVKSASGDIVIKFKVKLSIRLRERRIGAVFGLSDRSKHKYPVLIGRQTLMGKFIVDVEEKETDIPMGVKHETKLHTKMRKNPYKFYKEYYLNGVEKNENSDSI